jgi:hypothetical protein
MMATGAETLASLKEQLALAVARRREVLSGLKPTQSSVADGESVDWSGYLAQLNATIEQLRKDILAYEPYQVTSYGRA